MLNSWRAGLRAVWQPAMYHGHGKRKDFFEGWYFKFVDAPERHEPSMMETLLEKLRG